MEPRPPPPTVALPLQAKPSFQLFCRWRQPLNPLDPNGHQNNVSPYQYLAIPQGDQLQDRLYASRLWNGSGQRPENVELVARTPDGCEAVLKRYIESFSYDGNVRPSKFSSLFPPNTPNLRPGPMMHPHFAPSIQVPRNHGMSSGPHSAGVTAGGEAPPIKMPLSAPPQSYPPFPYVPSSYAQPQPMVPSHPANNTLAQHASNRFAKQPPQPPRAYRVSQQRARNASGVRGRRGAKTKSFSFRLLTDSKPAPAESPHRSHANNETALVKAGAINDANDSAATKPPITQDSSDVIVVDDSQSDALSPPQDMDDLTIISDAESVASTDTDYEMGSYDEAALAEDGEAIRVLEAIRNNYSGDRAGKHPRRPVRIAVYNELQKVGVKGHFGPRGDLLGGSSLRNFTLEQLGMTPKLWDHIDYKFGAGKTGKEMMTKEGGKVSHRVQTRIRNDRASGIGRFEEDTGSGIAKGRGRRKRRRTSSELGPDWYDGMGHNGYVQATSTPPGMFPSSNAWKPINAPGTTSLQITI